MQKRCLRFGVPSIPYDSEDRPTYLRKLPYLVVTVTDLEILEKEREKIVGMTQKEMDEFTKYLKDKFFNS